MSESVSKSEDKEHPLHF